MLNKDIIEKSLLLGVIQQKNWEVLLRNNITRECFSPANYRLYDYIKSFTENGKYPDIRITANEFDIDDVMLMEYREITSLDELCNSLHNEYVKNQVVFKVGQLNDYSDEMKSNPTKYIDRLSSVVEGLRKISYHTKSVGLFDNIERLLELDPNDVISTGFKELDEKLVGWKRGEELVVFVGRTGQGKEQPLSAKILTPEGWRTMRDMTVGTDVIGGDGKPAKVVGVFPQGIKDVYNIEFSDGTKAECGIDHLWKVKQYYGGGKYTDTVLSLRDMLNVLQDKEPYSKEYKEQFAIEYVPSNIEFINKLRIDDIPPYILGAIIGNGCLTHKNEISFNNYNCDIDVINKINDLLPNDLELRKISNNCVEYKLVDRFNNKNNDEPSNYIYKLKELGLMGKGSKNKFIPFKYLYGTYQQRLDLVRGICDTYGCSSNSNVQYLETTSVQLVKDFEELVRSLGCSTSVNVKHISYKSVEGAETATDNSIYTISFKGDFNPYYCVKKSNKWEPHKQIRAKFITNITKVRQEECQCIMLDNTEHTYITNDYTITHNTWLCLKFAMAAALAGETVGIYSGEMSQQQLQERMICCARPTITSTDEESTKFIRDKNIDIRLLTHKELRRRASVRDIEEFIVRDKLTMVVLDQLSLMEDITSKPRNTFKAGIWKYYYGLIYIIL